MKMDGKTMDITAAHIDALKELFPTVVSEGKIDFDKLRLILGDAVVDEYENYAFTWKGKSDAVRLAGSRSLGTLRPSIDESVNWDITQNLYIEGDNLEVLKLLRKAYFDKKGIKMIYIDPPYNTGNDFVYEDDFADNIANYKAITGQATKSNAETVGRYHTNWLNMMYPRLLVARTLLKDDGVIFISIDDHEVENLKKICNEVFGENNFVAQFNWKGRGGRQDSKTFAVIHEYILCYAKNIDEFDAGEEIKQGDVYPKFDEAKKRNYKTQLLRKWGSNSKRSDRPNLFYAIKAPDGSDLFPMLSEKEDGCWRWGQSRMREAIENCDIEFVKNNGVWVAYEKIYEPKEGEEDTKKYTTWIDNVGVGTGSDMLKKLFEGKVFDYPKPVDLIKLLASMANVADDDIILDFFSGSATTAHAVMQLNAEHGGSRKFIMVQLPQTTDEKSEAYKAGYKNICEIGKERIRRAGAKIGKDDIGFRVFKLDTSNIKKWDTTPMKDRGLEELVNRLNDMVDSVKADRDDLDIVFEIMLKLGLKPTYNVAKKELHGKNFYIVGDLLLLICLDKDVTVEIVEKVVADYTPGTLVLANRSLKDETALSNIELALKERKIDLRII